MPPNRSVQGLIKVEERGYDCYCDCHIINIDLQMYYDRRPIMHRLTWRVVAPVCPKTHFQTFSWINGSITHVPTLAYHIVFLSTMH